MMIGSDWSCLWQLDMTTWMGAKRSMPRLTQPLPLQKFHADGARVTKVDGFTMIREMANNVMTMMQHKIDAIKVHTFDWIGARLGE